MEIETKIDISPNDIWEMIEGEVQSAIEYAVDSAITDLDLSDQIAEGINDYDLREPVEDIIDYCLDDKITEGINSHDFKVEDAVRGYLEGKSLTIGSSTEKVEELQEQHIRLQTAFESLRGSVLNVLDALIKHFEQEQNSIKSLSDS